MSRHERYGSRSLVYSKWHRFYCGDAEPMIDLDAVEYCHQKGCFKPLVLIETARDIGQASKSTYVLKQLATQSGVLALCVLYRIGQGVDEEHGCKCRDGDTVPDCDHGIERFRVRRVWPLWDKPGRQPWKLMTPAEYHDRLIATRMDHIATEHLAWEVS